MASIIIEIKLGEHEYRLDHDLDNYHLEKKDLETCKEWLHDTCNKFIETIKSVKEVNDGKKDNSI